MMRPAQSSASASSCAELFLYAVVVDLSLAELGASAALVRVATAERGWSLEIERGLLVFRSFERGAVVFGVASAAPLPRGALRIRCELYASAANPGTPTRARLKVNGRAVVERDGEDGARVGDVVPLRARGAEARFGSVELHRVAFDLGDQAFRNSSRARGSAKGSETM